MGILLFRVDAILDLFCNKFVFESLKHRQQQQQQQLHLIEKMLQKRWTIEARIVHLCHRNENLIVKKAFLNLNLFLICII